MTEQLKPCPFCGGGTTEITENGRVWTGMKWGEPSSVSVRHWCEEVPGQPSRMLERVGRDHEAAIAAWNRRAQPTQAGVEPVVVPEDVIAGALYDFLGYLTSRRTRITMSDRDDAGAAVDALVDWSKTRKIRLEDACVKNWEKYTHPPARVPLTDEELRMISKQQDPVVVLHHNVLAFAHAIIAAYEAKNGIGGGK